MRRLTTAAAAILMAVTLASCSSTPTSPSAAMGAAPGTTLYSHGGGHSPLSDSDRAIAQLAAEFNRAILEISTIASSRADVMAVNSFAQQMLQDSKTALAGLREISPDNQSSTVSAAYLPAYTQVSQAGGGSELDRVYLAQVVSLFQTAIPQFQAQSTSATYTTLRSHLADTVVRLMQNLLAAQELAGRVRV